MAAAFEVEIFDWDQVGTSDSLGSGTIDLAKLEPMESQEVIVSLNDPKHGPRGEVKLQLVFTPQIVARTRKSTSTFAVGGRAMTQVASLPFGATRGLAHGIGGAGSKAKNFLGGVGIGRTKTIDEGKEPSPEGFSIPVPQLPPKDTLAVPTVSEPPSGQVSHPVSGNGSAPTSVFSAANTAAMSGEGSPPRETGTLRVSVIGAKDLSQSTDIKPYATLKLGKKEFQTKHVAKTTSPEWYVVVMRRICVARTDYSL